MLNFFQSLRYVLETTELALNLTLKFKASYPEARIRLQIWNINEEYLQLWYSEKGGFILPSVMLASKAADQESRRPGTTVYKYSISLFIEDNSWPLTEKEWDFVQKEKIRYLKAFRRRNEKKSRVRLELLHQMEMAKQNELKISSTKIPEQSPVKIPAKSDLKKGKASKKRLKTVTKVDSIESQPSRKSLHSKTKKRKMKRRQTTHQAQALEPEDKTGESGIESIASTYTPVAPVPALFPSHMPIQVPEHTEDSDRFAGMDEGAMTDASAPFNGISHARKEVYRSANLTITSQPRVIKHLDQPHWSLEILTDSTKVQNLVIIS